MPNPKHQYKNVKIRDHIHTQIKNISEDVGINVGRLIEMGAQKIIEDYQKGTFDTIKNAYKATLRRDGTLVRSS